MNLFVYGELCKAAVLRRQLGRIPPTLPAVLSNFTRRRRSSGYYAAEPAAGALLPGLLLVDLTEAELRRLDRFEGVDEGHYARVEVVASAVADGREWPAQVYVAGDADGGAE